jgi:uncharacterized protein YndB with AHSA1/START domain
MNEPARAVAIVRRLLPAGPEAVYDEWLDPEALAEFITPAPSRTGRLDIDPRVGGALRLEMIDGESVVEITGAFLELDRPNRLRFTWQSSLGGGFDSVVTVMFEPSGEDETAMTIEHALLPPDWRDDHEAGWTRIASQLEARLGGRGPAAVEMGDGRGGGI